MAQTWLLNGGLNTTSDRSLLAPGELQLATGAYYRSGDANRIWKLAGRSLFGTLDSADRILTVALCKYDTVASDKLVVLSSDGTLHTSALTTITIGAFSTLTTGLSTAAGHLAWTHFDDVWYLSNGVGENYAYESDGTFRLMGMKQPAEQLTGAVGAEGTLLERPTAKADTSPGWVSSERILSANYAEDNYTYRTTEWYKTDITYATFDTFAADTGTGRYLVVRWNAGIRSPDDPFIVKDSGGQPYWGTFKIQVDEGQGGGVETKFTKTIRSAVGTQNVLVPITDSIDTAGISVRIWLQNADSSGTSQGFKAAPFTARVFDVRITDTGNTSDFDPDHGYFYAYAEYDSARQLESPLVASGLIFPPTSKGGVTGNSVLLALPGSATNPLATEYKIYRTHDGGNVPGDLRYFDSVDIASTSWLDQFDGGQYGVGGESPPQLKVAITDDLAHFYSSNSAPLPSTAMVEYQNFVVALSNNNRRALFYSMPGEPEYWPELYQITDFPLQEHDKLVSLAVAGDLLIIGAEEALIVVNGLPEVEAQAYASAYTTVLEGAPGCVGPLAMTAYSLGGEPRVAWISEFGIFETNGHQVWELTHSIDFTTIAPGDQSSAALFWDKDDQMLYVMYDADADGYNDRFYTLHMSPAHRQGKRGEPKVTGPHYGRRRRGRDQLVQHVFGPAVRREERTNLQRRPARVGRRLPDRPASVLGCNPGGHHVDHRPGRHRGDRGRGQHDHDVRAEEHQVHGGSLRRTPHGPIHPLG
jgi:hypothetical protein